jgi:hypothetical protein
LLAADEAGQGYRQVVLGGARGLRSRGWRLDSRDAAGQDLFVEVLAPRAGLGIQFAQEGLPEPLVLIEGPVPPASPDVKPHQAGVRLFVRRLGSYQLLECLDGCSDIPPPLVESGHLHEQGEVRESQPFASLLHPGYVAVLRQEIPGV